MATPSITSSVRLPVDLYDKNKDYQTERGVSYNQALIELCDSGLVAWDKSKGGSCK